MKNVILVLVLMCLAVPAVAEDSLLSTLGLAGVEIVSDQEAQLVSGRGYVFAVGWSENKFDVDGWHNFHIFDDVDGEAYQELYLQGLSNLEGLTGASNTYSFDISQTEWEADNLFDAAGSFSSSSGTIVAGSAD